MDTVYSLLKICGIVIAALFGIFVIFILIGLMVYSLNTNTGNFIVTPETGEPFKVIKYTVLDSKAILYTKPNGVTGRITGSFRIETTLEKE